MSATELETPPASARPGPAGALAEGRRQMEICNACRYCEGYCAVFPAMTFRRAFSDGDMTYLANLCHDCRGCYYACQYTPPHAFAVNLPRALAEIRHDSWAEHAWPAFLGRAFARNGTLLALALVASVAAILMLPGFAAGGPAPAGSFYAIVPHGTMVVIFGVAFLFALLAMAMSVRRFWIATASPPLSRQHLLKATQAVLTMRNLSGGHGEGCNYAEEDRFTNDRRWLHQAALYGFLLCFASTASATVLHYGFGRIAPYDLPSLPKLLGVPGGILLCLGTGGLFLLRGRADATLEAHGTRQGDGAFTLMLFLIGFTGLALYVLRDSGSMPMLLAVHLGAVLAFFITMPYSRMVHGLYRMAALIRSEAERATRKPLE